MLHRGVGIDQLVFYANWCAPCRKLDQITFHHPDIVKLSQDEFIMVKVDLTKEDDQNYDRLLSKYKVKGVPTVVFLNTLGKERKDLRLVDFLSPIEYSCYYYVMHCTF